ncbi:hypothetical protein RP20_CCG005551 [Aedes albopictus]|nr:hypothetical protein RP20_CCG005551 [Aedes albopictus]
MESDKDIHSYFWERMQEAVGVLPKHLMRILNLQGYSSCDALAEVKDSDVTQIQSDMRLLAPVKKACLGTDEMRNLYGQFATSPESFIFLNGERKAILKIAEVVRKYGIHHFLPGTSGKPCTDFRPSAKSSDLADVLLRKIKTYYGSRRVDTIDFACFFAKLDGLTATVSIQEDGSAIGMVTCKMCKPEKTVKLKKTPMGTWLLGNFVKHSSQYHYCVRNSKPNMKRNSAEIVTSTPKKKKIRNRV